jgi:hypothetical protein
MHEIEFTAASFFRIATLDARRGRADPAQRFPAVNQIIAELKDAHADRRQACASLWKTDEIKARERYASFRPQIAALQNAKRAALEIELEHLSARLSTALQDDSFTWNMKTGASVDNRQTYRVVNDEDRHFAMRQVEVNLKSAHRLQPPNRNRLVAQLRDSLEGKVPRFVFRTDIASFYESVSHQGLLFYLRSQGGLSKTSLFMIERLFDEWERLTGRREGLPTGVGISAYLSELFARQIDDSVAGHPGVHFYGRYVDDIIVVARTADERNSIESEVQTITARLGLALNTSKTKKYDPAQVSGPSKTDPYDHTVPIDFLGYAISKSGGQINVTMSARTVDRYTQRLGLAFDRWASTISPSTGHEGLLLDRVKFLTGNTKLVNSKGRAVTGIYFNYPILSVQCPELEMLDAELDRLITANTATLTQPAISRLRRASFQAGFAERRFHRFSQPQLKRLVAVWRG